MATDLHFDLTTQPWLPVRLIDGSTRDLGLRECIVRAHEIGGLDLEYPTQEPALLRLLLAVCYRAFHGPANDDEWGRLWEEPALPEAAVDAYLERCAGRFDLFSSDAPFFQSPSLEAAGKDGVKTANKLVAYAPSGNNIPLFTPITDDSGLVLDPAEAARWLVERHAWGTASDKTGAKGNPKVRAGKDTPQVGHLAWIGFVAPIGATLRETLLLNLVPWSRTALVRSGPDDLPAWERDPPGASHAMRAPDGACDLFTWQTRRIRLFPETRRNEVVVARVLVCAGDEVDRQAVRAVDPHTGWRSTKGRDGALAYSPVRARTGQQVWRGLSALLALDESTSRAGVLSFVAALESRGVTSASLLVTAAELGSMSTTVTDLVADRLDTPVALLRLDDPAAATLAVDAVACASGAARALGYIADAPDAAFDSESGCFRVPEGRADRALSARAALAEELYGLLDTPFRRFVVRLNTSEALLGAREPWARTVCAAARDLARRAVGRLSPSQALAGAQAEVCFERELAKARDAFSPRDDVEDGAA